MSATTKPAPTATPLMAEITVLGQSAIRWTKRSLNLWLKQAAPNFEASLAYEMLGFFSDDVREGASALQERRPPQFPSAG